MPFFARLKRGGLSFAMLRAVGSAAFFLARFQKLAYGIKTENTMADQRLSDALADTAAETAPPPPIKPGARCPEH